MAGLKGNKEPVQPESDFDQENAKLLQKCIGIYKSYNDATFKYRRQWYLNDNFYDGKHFVWWRRSTGTIDRIEPPKGMVLRSMPVSSKKCDQIQNLMLANDPRWVVYPEKDITGQVTPDMENIAKRSGQWLEFKWDALNMKQKCGDLVHYALKFPYAFWEVGFDTDIWVTTWDAFDIQFQPEVASIYDSPVLIKSISKNIIDVKNNPNYNKNKDNLTPVMRYSADEMKDMRMVEKFGYHRQKDQDENCDLKEYYFKEFQPDNTVKIRIVTTANDKYVLRNELTNMDEYPFVLFSPHSGNLLQPAWIERMMAQNKSLDLIVSNIETYFHIMNKGYWIKHKNANVTRILNEHGQFIEWDVAEPHQAQMQAIPNYVFNHIANLEKWIDGQSVSSVSAGAVPKGVKAYKSIEAMKQSDAANMAAAIIRLETAIEKTAEIMLDFAERYYTEPRQVYRLQEQKPDYFNVVGANFRGEDTSSIPLKASYKVDVNIESGLAYTEEGKRQTMLELYSSGLVDAQTVLEAFKFSNVAEIIKKAQAEKQKSMIDTPDFQALSDPTKKAVLQELMQKNISIPQGQPEIDQFRRRAKKGGGM
jgi:hypothetical protein